MIRVDHDSDIACGESPDVGDDVVRLTKAVDGLAAVIGVDRGAVIDPLIEILQRRSMFEQLKTPRDRMQGD